MHGTMCAEIVHDVAPEAQLLLVNFGDIIDWGNAVDFVISQKADIVSHSGGWTIDLLGFFDGTGPISELVTAARGAGIFWAQAAGNEAEVHWDGGFNDPDGDSWLEFASGRELNTFAVPPGTLVQINISWNDWVNWDQDYNLFLYVLEGDRWRLVDQSTNIQSGPNSFPPVEIIDGFTPTGGTFGIRIQKYSATRDTHLELFVPGLPEGSKLEFRVAAGSLRTPADSPGAVTVGATSVLNDRLEDFSSQGPTNDGRVKPDLTAPDGVATSFGIFGGTSAAAPHVAGAAALVKSANRTFGPAQIQQYLEQNAVHLGAPGKNNQYGSGRLNLPPPPTGGPGAPTPTPGLPAPTPAPPGPVSAADAKIEIVFPHDAAGNPAPITGATLANLGAFLFSPSSLNPVPCNFGQPVRLFKALNSGVAEQVGTGTPSDITVGGKRITQWEFRNVDVAGATNPLNKYYFFLDVDGISASSNIWSHGADARTIFPQQDVPTGVGPIGSAVDAKIEAVFPHDRAGNPRSVAEADLANLVVDIFSPGTLVSAPPDADLVVRLFRSLNNGMQEYVAVGQKQMVTRNGVTHPRWVFNDVDVSAARTGTNKYYLRVVVDGVATRSNIWSHGADARTIFPQQDVPTSSCQ